LELAMGIDTGGTYTDGVIMDLSTGRVVKKSKSPTTHQDLTIGIRNCLAGLDGGFWKEIQLVCLSTTLATNATVEGKGSRVGLICLGHEVSESLPVAATYCLPGGHDIRGNAREPLDVEKLRDALKRLEGKVDALAVSGYCSVRNPEHELAVKDEAERMLEVPVVCGHQLTSDLGFQERTATAVLNARLLPVISQLLDSVQQVLRELGVTAPLMVVKGDGSLVDESRARQRPIDTVVSGPAASVVGATFLSGEKDALVVDIGGTTTDIASLREGVPEIHRDGAVIGGWSTKVQAARVHTFGIGGDSLVQVKRGEVQIGPRRVLPLSRAVADHPYLMEELKETWESGEKGMDIIDAQPFDCYLLGRYTPGERLTSWEREVVGCLAAGPHSILHISRSLGRDPNLLNLKGMINRGILLPASLTPTDLLHVRGTFTRWNREVAFLVAEMAALRLQMKREEFVDFVLEEVHRKIASAILQGLVRDLGYQQVDLAGETVLKPFLERILGREEEKFLCRVYLEQPVVAIGAPAREFMPAVTRLLNTRLCIPEHAEVANAIGAAVGRVVIKGVILVRPAAEGGYVAYTPWERKGFICLEDAADYAQRVGREYLVREAAEAGARDISISVQRKDVYSHISYPIEEEIFVESRISLLAVGRPWPRQGEMR